MLRPIPSPPRSPLPLLARVWVETIAVKVVLASKVERGRVARANKEARLQAQ